MTSGVSLGLGREQRVPGMATHAGSRRRYGRMSRGQGGVTPQALLLGLPRRAEIVHAVAGGAICGSDFGPRHDQLSVLAFEVLLLFHGVASAAEGRDFVRRSHSVRRDGARGCTMLHAGAVAGVATQSFLEMLVGLKIGDLFAMARRAEFVSFLGQQRQRQKQGGHQ